MQKLNQNIAICTLSTINQADRKELLKLLDAKFLKLDKKNRFLLEELMKMDLSFIDSSILFKNLRKNRSFTWSTQAFRESLSKINTILKDYIYLRDSKLKKFNYSIILSEFYSKEGLAMYLPTLTNVIAQDASLPSYTKYSEAYLTYHKLAVYDKKIRGRKSSDNFDLAIKNLNYAYWIEMLKMECEIKNRREKVKNFEIPSILDNNKELLEFVQVNFGGNILIQLYYSVFNLESEEDFDLLLENWKNSFDIILKEDVKSISIYLLNYCINQVAIGKNEYVTHYLTIIKVLIREDLLLEDGTLLETSFNNIFSLALKSDDKEWAFYFLDNYYQYLPEKGKSHTYILCKAKFLFAQTKFEEASNLLLEISLQKDFFFNVSANILLIKCYLELNMPEVALNKISNLELSISRAQGAFSISNFAENCLKFLTFLKLILKKEISISSVNPEIFVEREWLNSYIKRRK